MPAFLTPAVIRLIALGVAFLAFGGFCAYRMHAHDQIAYNALQSEFDTFKGGVKALGVAAEARKVEQEAADKQRKEKADVERIAAKRTLDGLYSAYASLRDSRKGSGGSILSSPAPVAGGSATATFDRAAFDRAISDFDAGAVEILKQGDGAISDLNTAKRWADQR